jgi:NodT family efflux transporter outer membrane factor (OMF) lipoprotein
LRVSLFFIFCLFWISGCISETGIHKQTIPLNDHLLANDNSRSVNIVINNADWWLIFHDAQLNKLMIAALSASPSLQIAKSRIDEATHIADKVNSTLWPAIDGGGQIGRERLTANGIYPPPFGGNTYTETIVGLNFNYEFDFWGKNRQALAAAINEKQAMIADYAEARLILTAAITSQYFQLQYETALLKILQSILYQRQVVVNIIKIRTLHGIESDIPLTTAIVSKANALLAVTAVLKKIKLSQHQLAVLIGRDPLHTDISSLPFNYKNKLSLFPKVVHVNVLAQRPDVIASRWRIERAAHKVKVAKARFYPNINLMALLSLQSYNLSRALDLASRDTSMGVALDLPLFDAGKRRADLALQYDEYDMAREQYNQVILTALHDVADQISHLYFLDKQEMQQTTALQASERNYALTLSRYRHGIADYMHVVEIQSIYLQEQTQQLQLQHSRLQSLVAMIKAVGGTIKDCHDRK